MNLTPEMMKIPSRIFLKNREKITNTAAIPSKKTQKVKEYL